MLTIEPSKRKWSAFQRRFLLTTHAEEKNLAAGSGKSLKGALDGIIQQKMGKLNMAEANILEEMI
jgi:hypothetical protein